MMDKKKRIDDLAARIVSAIGDKGALDMEIQRIMDDKHIGPQMKVDVFARASEALGIILERAGAEVPPPLDEIVGDSPLPQENLKGEV